jgi:hypothetical protein
MKTTAALATALLATVAAGAQASVITLQVAGATPAAQTSAAAYKSVVTSAMNSTAYKGSKSVASYDNVQVNQYFGSIQNYAFESTINFGVTAQQAGVWNFRTGVDFGFGGALFIDGVALSYNTGDMWWANSWNVSNGILSGSYNLAAGNHVLQVFGLESCCDGGQAAQFKAANAASYMTFASSDGLNAVAAATNVPEPASIATFGLGAAALAWARKRRANV